MVLSQADVFEIGLFPAVLAFCEVFRVQAFQESEVFIDGDALFEILFHLHAFGHPPAVVDPVVIVALYEGAFVGEAGEFVVGLFGDRGTRYSWNSKGTSLTLLRWFWGRSLRCMAWRG